MKKLLVLIIAIITLNACECYEAIPTDRKALETQIEGLLDARTRKLPFEAPVAWAMVQNGVAKASVLKGTEVPGSGPQVSDQSLFILASAAKLFTSVMVMKAVEDEELQLTASVSDYLKTVPAAWQPITISQLLSHADGIPDVRMNPAYTTLPFGTAEHLSRADYLAYAAELPLHFEPGSQSRYGQTGFVLLSAILEKVYEKPYENLIRDKILTPLGMTDTHFITHHSKIGDFKPQIFEPDGNGFKSITPDYVYADHATAGICSNLRDLVKFAGALQSQKLLSTDSFRRLYTPVKGLPGFALGWEYRYKDGELMAGHSGGWSVVIMHLPESNATSIFLSSAADESILDTGYQAAEKMKQFINQH